jgi:ABC-type polysaccharide/polyol phosphate export permease
VTRLIESTRDIFLFQKLPSLSANAVIIGSVAILILIGFLIFKRLESRFAEEI